jgi:hypothetical protein
LPINIFGKNTVLSHYLLIKNKGLQAAYQMLLKINGSKSYFSKQKKPVYIRGKII